MKRISLDPMPALRAAAEAKVNLYFNMIAAGSAQQDQEHAAKRAVAESVELPEDGSDPKVPAWFAEAAAIENRTVREFVLILRSKPNEAAARGNERRRVINAVRTAKTPAELDELTKPYFVPGSEIKSVLT